MFQILGEVLHGLFKDYQSAEDKKTASKDERKELNVWSSDSTNHHPAEGSVAPGRRPIRAFDKNVPNKLGSFLIPSELRQDLMDNNYVFRCTIEEDHRVFFRFHLCKEEVAVEKDYTKYDMSTRLKFKGDFLSFELCGLMKNRSSILQGDGIAAIYRGMKYEGFIHEIHGDEVMVQFADTFHRGIYKPEEESYISFSYSRTTFRRCCQAVECAKKLGDKVLFPTPTNVNVNPSPIKGQIKFYNDKLNDEQRLAVQQILEGKHTPTPFIIFGWIYFIKIFLYSKFFHNT